MSGREGNKGSGQKSGDRGVATRQLQIKEGAGKSGRKRERVQGMSDFYLTSLADGQCRPQGRRLSSSSSLDTKLLFYL